MSVRESVDRSQTMEYGREPVGFKITMRGRDVWVDILYRLGDRALLHESENFSTTQPDLPALREKYKAWTGASVSYTHEVDGYYREFWLRLFTYGKIKVRPYTAPETKGLYVNKELVWVDYSSHIMDCEVLADLIH